MNALLDESVYMDTNKIWTEKELQHTGVDRLQKIISSRGIAGMSGSAKSNIVSMILQTQTNNSVYMEQYEQSRKVSMFIYESDICAFKLMISLYKGTKTTTKIQTLCIPTFKCVIFRWFSYAISRNR